MGDVTTTFQTQYKNNVEMELQLHKNPLEAAVTVTSDASAEKIKIKDLIGNGDPQEDDEREGNTRWQRTPFEGVWLVKPNELYYAEIIENSDQLSTAIDLQGAATMNGASVVNRAKTRRILEGIAGDRITGKTGTTTNSFPGSSIIPADEGAAVDTKMSTAKLIAANKFFAENYVDTDMLQKFMILTAEDNAALLGEVPATSNDFKASFSATIDANGNLRSMLGFTFIHLELSNPKLGPVAALYTDADSNRLNPFWVKPGVVANYWQALRTEVGKIPERDRKSVV